MELTTQHSLLEELIMAPPKMDNTTWNPFQNECFPNNWTFTTTTPFDPLQLLPDSITNPSLLELISPAEYTTYPCPFGEYQPFLDALTSQEFSSFYEPQMPPSTEEYASNLDINQEFEFLSNNGIAAGFGEGIMSSYKVECANSDVTNKDIVVNVCGEKKNKSKKPEGQPSKNLMAERRRRKRLNDRLSMLRSIVPKISKMDRTSILGDTIDYMRELLDKIQRLREQGVNENVNQINPNGNYMKELKPNEMLVRNPPKFDVERSDQDTRVEVCCSSKPGLLLSTISTMDALGLDIQQCVISCFNDFSVQASCYEAAEQRSLLSSEDIKQSLFRNAGYGGRCL